MKTILFFILFLGIYSANATTTSEKHSFRIVGNVSYRCYAGYDGEKKTDEMTKKPCDNKTYNSTLIDKVILIDIKDEPDPENSKDLEGSWSESFNYQGRKFEAAVSLFKTSSSNTYRLRLFAADNEPTSRQTSIFSEMKNPKEMNPISVDYSSVGKKEEISFVVKIQTVN